jgi:ADP-ribosylglycohydrolase
MFNSPLFFETPRNILVNKMFGSTIFGKLETQLFIIAALLSILYLAMSSNPKSDVLVSPVAELAIADALGGGLEMRSAEYLQTVDLSKYYIRPDIGFNEGYVAGMITDDTWMTIGLMRAVVKAKRSPRRMLSSELLLESYQDAYNEETRLMSYEGKKGKWWGGIEPVLSGEISYSEWMSSKKTSGDPGNGSVMRAHILGYIKNETELISFAEQDAVFSHPHPIAIDCSRVIARLVHAIVYHQLPLEDVIKKAIELSSNDRVIAYLSNVDALPFEKMPLAATQLVCVENGIPLYKLKRGGTGVPCSALPTLAAALYVAKHHHDFTSAMEYAIRMGGDTDSVAIVTTSLVVAKVNSYGKQTTHPMASGLRYKAELLAANEMYRQMLE